MALSRIDTTIASHLVCRVSLGGTLSVREYRDGAEGFRRTRLHVCVIYTAPFRAGRKMPYLNLLLHFMPCLPWLLPTNCSQNGLCSFAAFAVLTGPFQIPEEEEEEEKKKVKVLT
jgi:hypothetical protein